MADGRGPGGELQGSPAAPEADLFGEDGEAEARVPMWTPATFIPPLNFGMVEEGVYRSGAPNELNFPFLEQLHLKTILYLAPDDPDQQLYARIAPRPAAAPSRRPTPPA